MASETLREYLIRLGFRVDEITWKKFSTVVGSAAGAVAELGAATVATGLAVGVAVDRISSHYTQLYYVSQRAGQSVAFLRSYELASRQIGISAEQATSTVNAMGIALRTNPGLAALSRGLTGQSGANPQALVKSLSNLPDFIATQFAGMFGLSPEEYLQRKDNAKRFDDAQEYYTGLLREAGLSTDQAKDNWNKTTWALDRVWGSLEVVNDSIVKDLISSGAIDGMARAAKGFAETFVSWDKQSGGVLGEFVSALGVLVGELTIEGILAKLTGIPGPVRAIAKGGKAIAGSAAAAVGDVVAPAVGVAALLGLAEQASKTPEGQAYKATGSIVEDTYGWLNAVKRTLQGDLGLTPDAPQTKSSSNWSNFLAGLSYLESNQRNVPASPGHSASGYFQFQPETAADAIKAGLPDPREGNYADQSDATSQFIRRFNPKAAAAIDAGDFDTASSLLRGRWPSLPGGDQAQSSSRYQTFNQELRGGGPRPSVTITNHITVNVPPGTDANTIANKVKDKVGQATMRSNIPTLYG